MWKIYSVPYIKNNKAASIFIMAAGFLSSMLLSFLSVFFYNLWADSQYRLFLMTGTNEEAVTPLVLAYLFILAAGAGSLILMLHSAFEVTMNSRLHQLGILKSVGATPRQVRTVLLSEAVALSAVPMAAGTLAGVGLSCGVMQLFMSLSESFRKYDVWFRYHPLLSAGSLLFAFVTVMISAWIPAVKLSRISPLEAIHYGLEPSVERMKRFRILTDLFGTCGELAGKSIYARRKAFRTTTLSLTLSFLAFISFLNIEAISGVFTQRTYFEYYRDKWDFLISMDEKELAGRDLAGEIRAAGGVESCIAYRKLKASVSLNENQLSPQLKAAGITSLSDSIIAGEDGAYVLEAAVYVLDDESFRNYCDQAAVQSIEPGKEAAAYNRIWDSLHSDWRDRSYIPFLNTEMPVSLELKNQEEASGTVPVTIASFTEILPEWREELQQHALTLIVSEEFYGKTSDSFPDKTVYFNVKTTSEQDNDEVLAVLHGKLAGNEGYTLDSRLEEETSETAKRNGLRLFMGFLAVLFSSIGLSNVFSATLGQIYQRRREFARYMSVGLSPKGVKKILMMETFILTFRPLILSMAVNIPLVILAVNASGLTMSEYWKHAPVLPTAIFTAFILFFVALAYALGAREICNGNLMDILKDDTLV